MKMKYLLMTIAVTLGSTLHIIAQNWLPKSSMNFPRHGACAASYDGKIFLFGGGNSDGNYVLQTEVYDPTTDSWSTKAPIPTPRGEMACAEFNGKIYVFGGYNPALPSNTNPPGALNVVEEYDPISDTWATKQPMPSQRSTLSAASINNKIYVVGDWPTANGTLEIYDPISDTWSTGPSSITGRMNANSSVTNGINLFFIGGHIASQAGNQTSIISDKNEMFNIQLGIWESKSSIPQAAFNGSATYLNNQIHYFGGSIGYAPHINTSNHYVYDIGNDLWSSSTPLTFTREYHVSVSLNDKIYIIGGRDENLQTTDVVEELSTTITNLQNYSNQNGINIFPNPTNDDITIEYSNINTMSGYELKIENSLGQEVFQTNITQQSDFLNLTNWGGNGLYFVHIIDAQGNTIDIRKIVLQ